MAGALRPVVFLMFLASALFVADGVLDGAYPGGPSWVGGPDHYGLGVLSYVFALANLLLALLIARGSERTLMTRVALSGFFLIERPLTAFALGPKTPEAVAVHFATAFIELVILVGAFRVWRLGRSVESVVLSDMFSLDAPSPATPAEDEAPAARPAPPKPAGRTTWTLGLLALLAAAALVADGIAGGFVPGGRTWGVTGDATGWLTYLYAVVLLTAAVPAVHGGRFALRLLLVLALIIFVERAFSPFALTRFDTVSLGLHFLAALIALALAVAAVGAIRSARRAKSADARATSTQTSSA